MHKFLMVKKRKAEKKSQPSIRLRVRRHFFSTIKTEHPLFCYLFNMNTQVRTFRVDGGVYRFPSTDGGCC